MILLSKHFCFHFFRSVIQTTMDIGSIKEFHDDLKNLVVDITDLFTTSILITITVNFINVVSNAYFIYLLTKILMDYYNFLLLLMSTSKHLWFFASIMALLFISIVSGSISDEVLYFYKIYLTIELHNYFFR